MTSYAMHIAAPPEAKGLLLTRFPADRLAVGAQVHVDAAEQAVIMRLGKPLGVLGPGVHALSPAVLPFLASAVDHAAGGQALRCELYFVSGAPYSFDLSGPLGALRDESGKEIPVAFRASVSVAAVEPGSLVAALDSARGDPLEVVREQIVGGLRAALERLSRRGEVTLATIGRSDRLIRQDLQSGGLGLEQLGARLVEIRALDVLRNDTGPYGTAAIGASGPSHHGSPAPAGVAYAPGAPSHHGAPYQPGGGQQPQPAPAYPHPNTHPAAVAHAGHYGAPPAGAPGAPTFAAAGAMAAMPGGHAPPGPGAFPPAAPSAHVETPFSIPDVAYTDVAQRLEVRATVHGVFVGDPIAPHVQGRAHAILAETVRALAADYKDSVLDVDRYREPFADVITRTAGPRLFQETGLRGRVSVSGVELPNDAIVAELRRRAGR